MPSRRIILAILLGCLLSACSNEAVSVADAGSVAAIAFSAGNSGLNAQSTRLWRDALRSGTFCTQSGFQSSVPVTYPKSYTVDYSCGSGNVGVTVYVTSDQPFNCVSGGFATEYTLKQGSSIKVSFPDPFPSGGNAIASTAVISYSVSGLIAGGGLKSTGSSISAAFNVEYDNIIKVDSSSACNYFTGFTENIESTDFTCPPLQSDFATCT